MLCNLSRLSNRRLLLQLSHYMGAVSMFCLYCVAGEKVVSCVIKAILWKYLESIRTFFLPGVPLSPGIHLLSITLCVSGFHGLAVVAWIYGIALGLFLYTSKMFCYSLVSKFE